MYAQNQWYNQMNPNGGMGQGQQQPSAPWGYGYQPGIGLEAQPYQRPVNYVPYAPPGGTYDKLPFGQ